MSFFRLFNNKEYKVLLENFTSLSFLQITNFLLPLITLPYLIRVLGVDKFGLIVFAQAFCQYFVVLTDFGFNLSAVREISIHRSYIDKVSEIYCSVMLIKSALTVLSLILLSVIVFSFSKFRGDWLIFYLSFGLVIGQTLFPIWFFQGMEKMKYIALLNILAKSIFTVCIFVFIRNSSDYIYVPLLQSLGFLVAGCIGQVAAFKNFKIQFLIPKPGKIAHHAKDSLQFFMSRVSVSLYTASNAFFLGLFASHAMVGYYAAAEKLYMAAKQLYQPLANAIYPYMAKTKNKILFHKLFKFSVLSNLIFCISLFLLSGIIIRLLYGNDFQVSEVVLKILTLALVLVVPSILLGYPYLAALGKAQFANGSVIIASLFHIAALLVLSQISMDAFAVAILVVITEAMVLFIRIFGVHKCHLWKIE